MPMLGTVRDVARHYGMSASGIGQWRKDGMPGSRGAWDTDVIDEWLANRPRPRGPRVQAPEAPNSNGPSEGTLEYWELRFRQARAELNELQLALQRGEYLSREESERDYVSRVLIVREGLLSAGKRLASRVVPIAGEDRQRALEEIDAYNRDLLIRFAEGTVVGVSDEMVDAMLEILRGGR